MKRKVGPNCLNAYFTTQAGFRVQWICPPVSNFLVKTKSKVWGASSRNLKYNLRKKRVVISTGIERKQIQVGRCVRTEAIAYLSSHTSRMHIQAGSLSWKFVLNFLWQFESQESVCRELLPIFCRFPKYHHAASTKGTSRICSDILIG